MGFKLGAKFGEVLEVGILYMSDITTMVKFIVNLSIIVHIMSGMYIESKNNEVN